MHILFESFFGIPLPDPRFFFHRIVFACFPCIWHVEISSASIWLPRYYQKFAWTFRKLFFSGYAIFKWMWTYKTQDSSDPTAHQLIVGNFFTCNSMGRAKQIPRRPVFFEQRLLHFVPSPAGFICLFLLKIGHANLSEPFVFELLICPPHGPSSILPSCTLPGRLHSPNSFAKPPPRFSVCDSGRANCS